MGNLMSHRKKLLKPHHLQSPLPMDNSKSNIKPILRPTASFRLCEPKKPIPQSVTFIDERIMSENKFKQPYQKHIEKVISPFYINISPNQKRRCRSVSNPGPLDYYFSKVQNRRRRSRPLQRSNSFNHILDNNTSESINPSNSIPQSNVPQSTQVKKINDTSAQQ